MTRMKDKNTILSKQLENPNQKIIESGKIDNSNKQIYHRSLFWLGNKKQRVKLKNTYIPFLYFDMI